MVNDIILKKLELEYSTTDIDFDSLFAKYKVDPSDVKDHKKWKKNLLTPKTKKEKKKHLTSHINVVANSEEIIEDNSAVLVPDPESEQHFAPLIEKELKDEEKTDLLLEASQAVIKGETPKLPTDLKKGVEGLRLLDTNLQNQAKNLLELIGESIDSIDIIDTRAIRDLTEAHVKLRDTYFNSKNPMINVVYGDLQQDNSQINNTLAQIIQGVEDDC